MPPEAEMPAANTQKPHCGRSKWIGGKTVPTWARLAPLLGEVGVHDGRGWHHFWARLDFMRSTSPITYAVQHAEMAFQRAGLVTFKPASPNSNTTGYSTYAKTL